MTIAIDKISGDVIGQVILDYGYNATAPLRLLGRDGIIRDVPRESVRLEVVR